ncbi:MAG: hypothetical protein EXR72_16630 [Myxococcales bacterium]|nr:hypothetical protein [Myxococcales bacterium]
MLPIAFALALAAFALLPASRANTRLLWSFVGAALVLLGWAAALFATARDRRRFTLAVVLRKQHYLQACAQGSVFIY